MAIKTYVTGSSTATIADNDVTVVGGTAGNEKIKVLSGVTGVTTDANIEKVDLAGSLADYKFVFVAGTGVQVQTAAGAVVTTIPSLNQATTVAFADGSASLAQTGASAFTLGSATIGTTAAAITSASLGTTFDTIVKSTVNPVTAAGAGQTFTLTTSTNIYTLTSGNDTVNGSTNADTLNGKAIIDGSASDSDVANIILQTAGTSTATISNVENININNQFGAANVIVDFANISHSTAGVATLTSTAGSNASAVNLNGANKITLVAGSGVTGTLTVNDVQKNGIISSQNATTVVLDALGSAATSDQSATLKLTGTAVSSLGNGGGQGFADLTIDSKTAANTITLDDTNVVFASAGKVTLTGDQSLTIKGATASLAGRTVTDSTTAGTTAFEITATTTGNDLSKAGFDKFTLNGGTSTHSLTFASGATVQITKVGDGSTNPQSIDLRSSVTNSQTADVLNLALNNGTTVAGVTLVNNATDAFNTINLSADKASSVILTASTGTDVVLSGSNNITLNATSTSKSITSNGYSGKLTASVIANQNKVTSGSGDDTITVGGDALSATVNGGTGNDTLVLKASTVTDISGVKFSNFDTLDVGNNNVSTAKTSQFDSQTLVLTGSGTRTLAFSAIDSQSVDLSKITVNTNIFSGSGAIALDGNAFTLSLNVNGTNASDSAIGGQSADTIKGNDGNDILVGRQLADSIEGGNGADYILGDGVGGEVQTLTITTAANATGSATITVLGKALALTGVADANVTATAGRIVTLVNNDADVSPYVTASNASGVVTLTYKIDGNVTQAAVAAVSSNAIASTDATGTAGSVTNSANDTILGGAGIDTIAGGGGVDSLTGGAGADVFTFISNTSNLANTTVINDYRAAGGDNAGALDTINLLDVIAAQSTVSTTVLDYTAQTSLTTALNAAALANTTTNGLSVFVYGGNTYAYVEGTSAGTQYVTGDTVIQIVGTPFAVGTSTSGLGIDGV